MNDVLKTLMDDYGVATVEALVLEMAGRIERLNDALKAARSETRTFSDFIRNATEEEKRAVYEDVMRRAADRQNASAAPSTVAPIDPDSARVQAALHAAGHRVTNVRPLKWAEQYDFDKSDPATRFFVAASNWVDRAEYAEAELKRALEEVELYRSQYHDARLEVAELAGKSAPSSTRATCRFPSMDRDFARNEILKGAKKRQQSCTHGHQGGIELCRSCCLDEAAAVIAELHEEWAKDLLSVPSATRVESAWVPVTERLPETHDESIGWLVFDGENVSHCRNHPSWWNYKDDRGTEHDGQKVTHWMPIPKGPK